MLCVTREELLARSSWSGASGPSRTLLLTALEAFVPPALSPPPHRLHTLLSQARAFQTASGPYVVGPRRGQTLFRDAEGRREGFPLRAAEKRADPGVGELWNLAWSKDGRRLVTVGTGRKIVVYAVGVRPPLPTLASPDARERADMSGAAWLVRAKGPAGPVGPAQDHARGRRRRRSRRRRLWRRLGAGRERARDDGRGRDPPVEHGRASPLLSLPPCLSLPFGRADT